MRLWSFFLVFWALGSVGYANPVTVRTGEHANFTRVVLFLGDGTNWQFDETVDGYRLTAAVADGFDLSNFYALIPRTRIEAVQQRADLGRLDFAVSCACRATSVQYSPNIVVIDVVDGIEDAPQETNIANDVQIEDAAANLDGQETVFTIPRAPIIPLIPTDPGFSTIAKGSGPSEVSSLPKTQEFVDEIQARVARALGEGLAAGVLATRDLDTGANESIQALDLSALSRIPGIEARTSIDAQTGWSNTLDPTTQTGRICLPDHFFDLASWGDSRPFGAQIGEGRTALLGEFDAPQLDSGVQLAQRFIYFGFGQEALQALEVEPAQSMQRRVLADIARAIDGLAVDTASYADQVSCPSSVALWALLLTDGVNLLGRVERDSVLISFKALPETVQSIIAPRLSTAFVRLGDMDASRQILERGSGPQSDQTLISIAESNLASAQAEVDRAVEVLDLGLRETGRASPELMIRFFEAGSLSGRRFGDSDFALADSVRFEARGAATEISLAKAQFLALLSMKRFDDAQELLAELSELLATPEYNALKNRFARDAVEGMPDGMFGEFAWDDERIPSDQMTRAAISNRLIKMGFPERAMQVLGATSMPMTTTSGATLEDATADLADTPSLSIDAAEPVQELPPATTVSEFDPASLLAGQDLVMRSALLRDRLQLRLDAVAGATSNE